MKNAAVFMFLFSCVKSLATAPQSAEKKKWTEYLEEVFALLILASCFQR